MSEYFRKLFLRRPLPSVAPVIKHPRIGSDAAAGSFVLAPLEPRLLLSGTPLILSLGDSITRGVIHNVDNPNPSGYRYYLQNLLNDTDFDYDFIGNKHDGHSGMDPDHWGSQGSQAAVSSWYDGGATEVKGLKDDLDNQRVYDVNSQQPDFVLLHIGANTLSHYSSSVTDPYSGANAQFDALMDSLRRGLDDGEFASDVTFLIAQIVPRGGWDVNNLDQTGDAIANVAAYNQHIADYLDDLIHSDDLADRDFASHLQLVDMYSITTADLDQQLLADLFTAGNTDLLLDQIDPDADGLVDWFNGLDESDPAPDTSDIQGRNDFVFDDQNVHPTELGYAIMAQVWASALIPLLAQTQPGRVIVSPPSRDHTSEDGVAAAFTLTLSQRPTANVTFTLTLSDASEALFANGTTTRNVTLTADNWDTGVALSVLGQDDASDDGDITYTISFSNTASTDPAFGNLSLADKTLTLTNRDNDEPPPPQPAAITGRLFADANVNGRLDANEAGIAGWTVYLDADNNGSLDAGESSVNTDTQGNYSFTDLDAGNYVVRYHLAPGWQATPGATASYVVAAAAGQTVTSRDFAASLIPDPTTDPGDDDDDDDTDPPPDSTPDAIGQSFASALRLPLVNQPAYAFTESVGGDDSSDMLRFTLAKTSKVFVRLAGLTHNVKLNLYNANGKLIQSYNRNGIANERFVRKLAKGRYFIRVAAVDPDVTAYNFKIVTHPLV
jgi:lysophospholipase L1-like esterase